MNEQTIQHFYPVWREKVNYILRVKTGDKNSLGQEIWEQLWTRQDPETVYEICCIPFKIYNVSLGDKVSVDENRETIKVISPSGHYTFRVWFGDSNNPNILNITIEELTSYGCLFEWYSENLLAIDAPDSKMAQCVADFLIEKEEEKQLVYETGKQSGPS